MRRLIGLVAVLMTAACSPAVLDESADTTWVGTSTTEGNVTTVINESGSVWGGVATLVEEASIGVESGDAEYMLGGVGGVYANHEYIVVADRQAPAVRVYDLNGAHVRDLGGEGQGPGEYTRPSLITGDADGRVFVLDSRARRFNVYGTEGDVVGTWPAQEAMCCAYPMIAAGNGRLWARRRFSGGNQAERPSYYGLQQFGPQGPEGEVLFPAELDFTPIEIDVVTSRRTYATSVPFGPQSVWIASASGAIVTGASDQYRFEIQHFDGTVTVVERRNWEPIAVQPDEADWRRDYIIAGARFEDGTTGWSWDGAEIPDTKPAFSGFVSTATGDTWVRREGAAERLPDCAENPVADGIEAASNSPCWRASSLVDVFDASGRFLGSVDIPRGMNVFPAHLQVRGNQVVSVVEDEAGTIMVKRYRLVLPGEEGE